MKIYEESFNFCNLSNIIRHKGTQIALSCNIKYINYSAFPKLIFQSIGGQKFTIKPQDYITFVLNIYSSNK